MTVRGEKKRMEGNLEGFVYRVPGPGGIGHRWIARSIYGHAAHGKTPAEAARSLAAGMKALAKASGEPYRQWCRRQTRDSSRFLRDGELVQARDHP